MHNQVLYQTVVRPRTGIGLGFVIPLKECARR